MHPRRMRYAKRRVDRFDWHWIYGPWLGSGAVFAWRLTCLAGRRVRILWKNAEDFHA